MNVMKSYPSQKKLVFSVTSLVLVYILMIGLGYMLQRSFILHPKKLDKSYKFEFNFDFNEFTMPISEGQLHAIHAKTRIDRKGTILYFHGNSDNLKRWGKVSEDFLTRGYDVLMMDYRGFGKSDGRATEQNMYTDAKSLYNYALKQYSTDEIVIYGRSIGSGVASQLAEKVEAKQLMLETPFYSIQDVVEEKYPFVLMVFKLQFQFPNYKHIDQIEIPVHIFHGTKDKVVPYDSAEKLKKHLKEMDTFLTIEGGGHKNIPSYEVYQKRLDVLL